MNWMKHKRSEIETERSDRFGSIGMYDLYPLIVWLAAEPFRSGGFDLPVLRQLFVIISFYIRAE